MPFQRFEQGVWQKWILQIYSWFTKYHGQSFLWFVKLKCWKCKVDYSSLPRKQTSVILHTISFEFCVVYAAATRYVPHQNQEYE